MSNIYDCTATLSSGRTPSASNALRSPCASSYAAFLAATLPDQTHTVAVHSLGAERVWIKRAGPRHGPWRYRLLALAVGALRLDALAPVPNCGGTAAIAIEARRLRELEQAGLRVPAVLAQQDDGLLISDLGANRSDGHGAKARPDGPAAVALHDALEHSAADPAALLALWRRGLEALAAVHARGLYLSQAFARNLVLCPDGVIGYIDFEDDPGQTLSLVQCQLRDWLSYLHSTAAQIDVAHVARDAGGHWHAILAESSLAVRQGLAQTARRMRWLGHLPAGRRWGRDTQRVRAAARLLDQWYANGGGGLSAPRS
jgi:hypothetical protein